MIPSEGRSSLADFVKQAATAGETPGPCTIDLFKNNVVVDDDTELGDLDIADFSGYGSETSDGASWAVNGPTMDASWELNIAHVDFEHDGGGTANTIYGGVIHRDGKIISARNFGPKVMAAAPDHIVFHPYLGFSVSDSPTGGGTTIVTDTFTDADSTAMASHVADTLQTWSGSGAVTIESNAAEDITAGGESIFLLDAGSTQTTSTMEFAVPGSLGSGIFFDLVVRAQNATNFLMAQVENIGGTDHRLSIYKNVAGVYTLLAAPAAPFTPNVSTTYTIIFECDGDFLTAKLLEGTTAVQSLSVVDSTFNTETQYGFRIYTDGTHPCVRIDNFTITTP